MTEQEAQDIGTANAEEAFDTAYDYWSPACAWRAYLKHVTSGVNELFGSSNNHMTAIKSFCDRWDALEELNNVR
jgi:hypothetical protein